MKIFINPGHDLELDPGACGFGLRECDVAANIGASVAKKLQAAGQEVYSLQSDDLSGIPWAANNWGADLFVSIHCNACNGTAKGTETCIYAPGTQGAELGKLIQNKIVSSLGTVDRGLKVHPEFCVLRSTDMPAVLVETAFIERRRKTPTFRPGDISCLAR